MRASEFIDLPPSFYRFYDEIEEVPTRVPSLVDAAKTLGEAKSVEISSHFSPDALSVELQDCVSTYFGNNAEFGALFHDKIPITATLPGSYPVLYLYEGNIVIKTGEKKFIKLSRFCSIVDEELREHFHVSVNPFMSWFEQRSSPKPCRLAMATDLPNFILTAHGGRGVGSCHRLDGEYKYGQFLHLINPSVGHFFIADGGEVTTGYCGKPIMHRLARANVFAMWTERGEHVWILSRVYGDPAYCKVLVVEVISLAGKLNVHLSISYEPCSGSRERLFGEVFDAPKSLPRAYDDVGEHYERNETKAFVSFLARLPSPPEGKEYRRDPSTIPIGCESAFYEANGVTCHRCGDEVDEEDIYNGADDEQYCASCFDRSFTICHSCGSTQYIDETSSGPDDESYCERCFDEYFVLCNNCNEAVDDQESWCGADKASYCEACFGELFRICKGCEETFDKDDLNEEGYCKDCLQGEEDGETQSASQQTLGI